MKNNLLKFYLFAFVLFSDFVMFAQVDAPAEESEANDLEGADAPQAPINGKLIYLAIAGILFAIYTYRNNKKVA